MPALQTSRGDHAVMQGHHRKPVASSNPVSDGMCEKVKSKHKEQERSVKGPPGARVRFVEFGG